MSEPWALRKRIKVAIGVLVAAPVVLVLTAAVLFIAYIVAWFNAGIFFSGDGTYRRGVDGAAFQVKFPAVDLSRTSRSTFHFTRLAPPIDYAVGLRVDSERRPSAVVSMTLQNERGEVVFQQKRRLSEWLWRRNMAVIHGESAEVPIGSGSVRIENRGKGPDGGWGTYFEPRWLGRYNLTVEVVEPDPLTPRLLANPVIEAYTAWF